MLADQALAKVDIIGKITQYDPSISIGSLSFAEMGNFMGTVYVFGQANSVLVNEELFRMVYSENPVPYGVILLGSDDETNNVSMLNQFMKTFWAGHLCQTFEALWRSFNFENDGVYHITFQIWTDVSHKPLQCSVFVVNGDISLKQANVICNMITGDGESFIGRCALVRVSDSRIISREMHQVMTTILSHGGYRSETIHEALTMLVLENLSLHEGK